jgi:hypothetical protein
MGKSREKSIEAAGKCIPQHTALHHALSTTVKMMSSTHYLQLGYTILALSMVWYALASCFNQPVRT